MDKHGKYRTLVRLLALLLALTPTIAQAVCRQALALGHDVSGSVDRVEYDVQFNGLTDALLSQDVQDAFFAMPDAPVRLYVYEWSGKFFQSEIVPWTEINTPQDLIDVVKLLREPSNRPRSAETAVGVGMLYGGRALSEQTECWRRTLDISADGKSNNGIHPTAAALSRDLSGVTINALIIATDARRQKPSWSNSESQLRDYYQTQVIQGPDAFVESAIGYKDYRKAIEKKLLKELQTRAIGTLNLTDTAPIKHH